MVVPILYKLLLALSWLVALNWVWRVAEALRKLPGVPDLLQSRYDVRRLNPQCGDGRDSGVVLEPSPEAGGYIGPTICVIVPACNEEATIGATLESLLATEAVAIEIIAIDDRSTDATGAIMDAVAESAAATSAAGPQLRVVHLTDLPEGWLGKPHAMALAARQTTAEWLLFTDGDVIYRPDALRRAVQFVTEERADHLVLYPTLLLEHFGERLLMCCVQVLSIWMVRPWKVADPIAVKDSVGVGAFNMVRREVYTAVGGYESLRMEVLDDLRLGYKIKRAGSRQRVAFGRGLLRIRWAVGIRGLMRNMVKNGFAVFQFRIALLIGACCGLAFLSLMPFAAALLSRPVWSSGWIFLHMGPGLIELASLGLLARYYKRHVEISPAYVLTFPVGVCLLLFAILRSMIVTLRNGGVRWRGTLYPLSELRKHVGPLR